MCALHCTLFSVHRNVCLFRLCSMAAVLLPLSGWCCSTNLHWELVFKRLGSVLCLLRSLQVYRPSQTSTSPHRKRSRRSTCGGRKSASRSTEREWHATKTPRASGGGRGTWTKLRTCKITAQASSGTWCMGWIIIVFLLAHCQQQPFSCFIFMSGEYYGIISAAATDSLHFQHSQTWIGHQLAYLFIIIIIYSPIGVFFKLIFRKCVKEVCVCC